MVSAREHPAAASGTRTVFSGARILAVSAMKWTPAKTIVDAVLAAASRDRASESPTWSATSWISGAWELCARRTAARSRVSRRTSSRQASHWRGVQLDAVGADSVAVTADLRGGGFVLPVENLCEGP